MKMPSFRLSHLRDLFLHLAELLLKHTQVMGGRDLSVHDVDLLTDVKVILEHGGHLLQDVAGLAAAVAPGR